MTSKFVDLEKKHRHLPLGGTLTQGKSFYQDAYFLAKLRSPERGFSRQVHRLATAATNNAITQFV